MKSDKSTEFPLEFTLENVKNKKNEKKIRIFSLTTVIESNEMKRL
jgi:hypothetical protein